MLLKFRKMWQTAGTFVLHDFHPTRTNIRNQPPTYRLVIALVLCLQGLFSWAGGTLAGCTPVVLSTQRQQISKKSERSSAYQVKRVISLLPLTPQGCFSGTSANREALPYIVPKSHFFPISSWMDNWVKSRGCRIWINKSFLREKLHFELLRSVDLSGQRQRRRHPQMEDEPLDSLPMERPHESDLCDPYFRMTQY